jgi:hypothetical protein
MPALRLDDEIHTIILNASRPIAPQRRDAFVIAVTQALFYPRIREHALKA